MDMYYHIQPVEIGIYKYDIATRKLPTLNKRQQLWKNLQMMLKLCFDEFWSTLQVAVDHLLWSKHCEKSVDTQSHTQLLSQGTA